MKRLLNWRQWARFGLFAAGCMAVALIFGEDNLPISQWITVRLWLASAAVLCFYPLAKLTRKWERENKIPGYVNDGDTEI